MVLRITIKGLTRWQKHTHLKTNSSVKTSSCDLQSTFPTSREAEATNSPAQCEADLQSSARQCVWECVKEYETADCPLHTDPCLHSSQIPNMLIHTLIQTHTHTHTVAQGKTGCRWCHYLCHQRDVKGSFFEVSGKLWFTVFLGISCWSVSPSYWYANYEAKARRS